MWRDNRAFTAAAGRRGNEAARKKLRGCCVHAPARTRHHHPTTHPTLPACLHTCAPPPPHATTALRLPPALGGAGGWRAGLPRVPDTFVCRAAGCIGMPGTHAWTPPPAPPLPPPVDACLPATLSSQFTHPCLCSHVPGTTSFLLRCNTAPQHANTLRCILQRLGDVGLTQRRYYHCGSRLPAAQPRPVGRARTRSSSTPVAG